jgi:hypothetical protein
MSTTDPRILNVIAAYDTWTEADAKADAGDAARFAESIVERIDWSTISRDAFVVILTAATLGADGELLDELSEMADLERRIHLECTIGHDLGERLQSLGISPYDAEQIAHQAIRGAVEQAREQAKQTTRAA